MMAVSMDRDRDSDRLVFRAVCTSRLIRYIFVAPPLIRACSQWERISDQLLRHLPVKPSHQPVWIIGPYHRPQCLYNFYHKMKMRN